MQYPITSEFHQFCNICVKFQKCEISKARNFRYPYSWWWHGTEPLKLGLLIHGYKILLNGLARFKRIAQHQKVKNNLLARNWISNEQRLLSNGNKMQYCIANDPTKKTRIDLCLICIMHLNGEKNSARVRFFRVIINLHLIFFFR